MEDVRTDREILLELEKTVRAINTAFLKDENGEIDYAAHRVFHRAENISEEDNRKKRSKIIADVTTWAVIGLITVILSQVLNLGPQINSLIGK